MSEKFWVVVTGGRDYDDRPMVNLCLDRLRENGMSGVVHGGCPTGADSMAHDWVQERKQEISYAVFPANWEKHGKMAGPIRNQCIIDEWKKGNIHKKVILLAFPGGRGTADMRRRAEAAGMLVVRPWTLNDLLCDLTTSG